MSKFKFTKKSKRVFELSQKLNDGLISESEGQELNQLIKDDAELQLIYLGLREQELELTSRFSGTVIADRPLSGELVIPHQETARFYRIVTPLSIIIILIMAIFLGRDLLSDKKVKASSASVSTVSPVPQKKPFKETLASIDVVLGIDERDLLAGKELYAGVLEFEQGKLCLSMSSGMKMTIEGPAKINLLSADSIEVLSGKLRFKSQLQRHGFTVSTPQATITSQEAEFGLWLNSEVASLSCFSGSLRVRQKSYTQLVDKGQSISLLKNKKARTSSYLSLQE
ncbi:MAG: hypothetical protein HRT88_22765 [Lentisphaeraceae bacterium]|nr:hypothetical protein [Lentisphaeraceae bacterium]